MNALQTFLHRAAALVQPGYRHQFLTVMGDRSGWVLDHEAAQLVRVMRHLGREAFQTTRPWRHQVGFFLARDAALRGLARWRDAGVLVCFPYFHGYPGEGDPAFDATFDLLRRGHEQVSRIQVTHRRMHALVLESGIAAEKVRSIVIGVDTTAFAVPTVDQRRAIRRRLGIPESAVVVGSFQKDGNGWGQGNEAKRIKGPDVLVDTLTRVKARVPELFVLLSGPARGFVKHGLSTAGIPFLHATLDDPSEVPELYHALDAYLVASRQEGGPKAILESMASGVPIVSTRVGQATDLIHHGETGWLADIEDVEALAEGVWQSLDSREWLAQYRAEARRTAELHDYLNQAPQWVEFFGGVLSPAPERTHR